MGVECRGGVGVSVWYESGGYFIEGMLFTLWMLCMGVVVR